jgi:Phosphate-selective porin O and P
MLGAALAAFGSAPAHAQPAPPAGSTEERLTRQIETQQADLAEQDGRLRALEKKLAEVLARQKEAEKAAPPPAPVSPPPAPPPAPAPPPSLPPGLDHILDVLRNLTFSAYVQAQYESHQDAQDQLDPSGNPLNTDRFVLRRARLKVEKEWQYASTMVEVDGNTVNGPAFNLWHAEASVLYRGEREFSAPPILKLTFGLFDTPFGYELVESPKTRWFMERSLASRSLWPSEPDLGARLTSALGWFRASVAVLNGNPIGEKNGFALRDPAQVKDIVARVGADLDPVPWLSLVGGVSVYNGKGFHAGTPATKNTLQYVDMHNDGEVDPGDIVLVPGVAATPSQTFERWAVGGDLRAEFRTPIGPTRITFEVVVADNMDRGLFIADPVANNGTDIRELGFTLGATQELFGYGVLGFRFDSYDPNADKQTLQGGTLLPTTQTIRTFSPLVGLTLPEQLGGRGASRARLLFEYDVVRDQLGLTSTGLPTDLRNDVWTLRLQGSL